MLRLLPIHTDVPSDKIAAEFLFGGKRIVCAAAYAKIAHSRRSAARVSIYVIEL